MPSFLRLAVGGGMVSMLFAGCVTADPAAALPGVQEQVRARSGETIAWPQTPAERARTDADVRDLLAADLTPDSAVRIALLNNRGLRATFAELGLSQAGLAAAARLPNPSLEAGVRWPHSAPRGPNVEFGLAAPLLELLLLPARKNLAQSERLQTQYRVSHEVLALAAAARNAAFEVLAQQDLRARLAVIAEVNAAAADLARRQFEAGNIPQRELVEIQAEAQETRVEMVRADAEVRTAREQLNRLLGLTAGQTGWKLPGPLPPIPAGDDLTPDPEGVALESRLDLAALRAHVELARRQLDLKHRTRFLPGGIEAGASTERDSDGGRSSGPGISVELPLFDQGQPEIARLNAEFHQAEDRAEALAADIGSEVRTARDRLTAARQAVEFYEQTLLPQRRTLLRETLLHYNAMQVGTPVLLAAKRQQQLTERRAIEARRDYWLARTELERALGRKLPSSPPATAREEATPEAPRHSHH